MTIPHLDAALARGRARALARMTSRVTVWRKGALGAQDETTGLQGSAWSRVAVGVPFRLAGSTSGAGATRTQTIGGVEVQTALRRGDFPALFPGLRDGDHVEVTAGENAGKAFRLLEVDAQDQATALRVPLIAVDRPKEWTP